MLVLSQRERFWKYVDKGGPVPIHRPELGKCWIWIGAKQTHGYGSFRWMTGHTTQAHRWSYTDATGDNCEGFEIDHLCRNHSCVRPDHLEKVTTEENMKRTRKTHCIRGHEMSGTNLIHRNNGFRECRSCHNATQRNSRRRRNAKKEATA